MNCNKINTSNNNGSNNAVPIIKHVYGNVLRMAIPLTKRVVTMEDGEVVATDENFIPSSNYPVSVQFVKDAIKIDIPAIMMGNVAVIEDKGTIPKMFISVDDTDTWAIEIMHIMNGSITERKTITTTLP